MRLQCVEMIYQPITDDIRKRFISAIISFFRIISVGKHLIYDETWIISYIFFNCSVSVSGSLIFLEMCQQWICDLRLNITSLMKSFCVILQTLGSGSWAALVWTNNVV